MGNKTVRQKKEEKEKILENFFKVFKEEQNLFHEYLSSQKQSQTYSNLYRDYRADNFHKFSNRADSLNQVDLKGVYQFKEEFLSHIEKEYDSRREIEYQQIWGKINEIEIKTISEEIRNLQLSLKPSKYKSTLRNNSIETYERNNNGETYGYTQAQPQLQISKNDAQQSMGLDYYLVETFQNVINAFIIYDGTGSQSKDKEANKIALDVAIDNSNAQFKQCRLEYPSSNKTKLKEYMDEFSKRFEVARRGFKSKDLKYQIEKFQKVINGEDVPLTKYETVNSINPKDALVINNIVQKSYSKTDKTMEEISRKDTYEARPINNKSPHGVNYYPTGNYKR